MFPREKTLVAQSFDTEEIFLLNNWYQFEIFSSEKNLDDMDTSVEIFIPYIPARLIRKIHHQKRQKQNVETFQETKHAFIQKLTKMTNMRYC